MAHKINVDDLLSIQYCVPLISEVTSCVVEQAIQEDQTRVTRVGDWGFVRERHDNSSTRGIWCRTHSKEHWHRNPTNKLLFPRSTVLSTSGEAITVEWWAHSLHSCLYYQCFVVLLYLATKRNNGGLFSIANALAPPDICIDLHIICPLWLTWIRYNLNLNLQTGFFNSEATWIMCLSLASCEAL